MPRIGNIYDSERGPAAFIGIGKDGEYVYREIATGEHFTEEGSHALPEDDPNAYWVGGQRKTREVDTDQASDADATPDDTGDDDGEEA